MILFSFYMYISWKQNADIQLIGTIRNYQLSYTKPEVYVFGACAELSVIARETFRYMQA